jgi:hypothetical protein
MVSDSPKMMISPVFFQKRLMEVGVITEPIPYFLLFYAGFFWICCASDGAGISLLPYIFPSAS